MLAGSINSPAIKTALTQAAADPGAFAVYVVCLDSRPVSVDQRKLFHRLLRCFAQQQGGSVEGWRDFLVRRFLGTQSILTPDGDEREVPVSTRGMSCREFHGFLTACLALADEHQVVVI